MTLRALDGRHQMADWRTLTLTLALTLSLRLSLSLSLSLEPEPEPEPEPDPNGRYQVADWRVGEGVEKETKRSESPVIGMSTTCHIRVGVGRVERETGDEDSPEIGISRDRDLPHLDAGEVSGDGDTIVTKLELC